jgi:hypothetical protein
MTASSIIIAAHTDLEAKAIEAMVVAYPRQTTEHT